jgi:hypothetical protein
MALTTSTGIVTNGLVFAYDMYSQKSYKGPPLRNHINTIVPQAATGTGFVLTGGSEVVDIPTLGQTNVNFSNYQNINSGGNYCCTAFMNYGNAGNIFTGSTLYTYLILYRTDSGYTHPNWMYRYEYNSSGTYQTEAGVHDNSRRTYLGNGWYYAWGTFTTQAATTNLQCYSFTYNYSSFNDKISVAKVCILPGNYSGLHPRYWPETNATRSTTQAVLDLTGNNTITATSLTYASDGTFSFNGSSDYFTIPNTTLGNGNVAWTVSCWMKTTTTTNSLGQGSVLSNISGGPVYSMMGVNNGKIVYWTYQNSNWAQKLGVGKTVNDGNWHMLTWVNYTNSTMDMYVDGVIDSNVANSTSGNNNPVDVIGRSWAGYFPGSIATLSRYTSSLTATEVQQNFNALRGRYGL